MFTGEGRSCRPSSSAGPFKASVPAAQRRIVSSAMLQDSKLRETWIPFLTLFHLKPQHVFPEEVPFLLD